MTAVIAGRRRAAGSTSSSTKRPSSVASSPRRPGARTTSGTLHCATPASIDGFKYRAASATASTRAPAHQRARLRHHQRYGLRLQRRLKRARQIARRSACRHRSSTSRAACSSTGAYGIKWDDNRNAAFTAGGARWHRPARLTKQMSSLAAGRYREASSVHSERTARLTIYGKYEHYDRRRQSSPAADKPRLPAPRNLASASGDGALCAGTGGLPGLWRRDRRLGRRASIRTSKLRPSISTSPGSVPKPTFRSAATVPRTVPMPGSLSVEPISTSSCRAPSSSSEGEHYASNTVGPDRGGACRHIAERRTRLGEEKEHLPRVSCGLTFAPDLLKKISWARGVWGFPGVGYRPPKEWKCKK